jgi:hypothetical protein
MDRVVLALIALLWLPASVRASEVEIRAAIDAWYAELRKGPNARTWTLLASNAVVGPLLCPDRCGPQPRVLKYDPGSAHRHLLAVRAQLFKPEIETLVVEGSLAKAEVWERGFTYAWAVGKTYENAAGATFMFESRDGGPWKLLLYTARSSAVRPKDRDQPLPDLSPGPQ